MGGQPLVTACVFCLLCATPSHCSGHHGASLSHQSSSPLLHSSTPAVPHSTYRKGKVKRTLENDIVKAVFSEFGEGDFITKDGFIKLLESLGLQQDHKEDVGEKIHPVKNVTNSTNRDLDICLGAEDLLMGENEVSSDLFVKLCPTILYQLLPGSEGTPRCHNDDHEESNMTSNQTAVWIYASLSVLLISLCGLLAVVVIPLMHKAIYHSLLQYLVALAVGTLCGDALLHLLPHAMMPAHAHGHGDNQHHHLVSGDQHETNLWRGLTAALSVAFFYFMEKTLSFLAKWRKTWAQKHKYNTKVRVMRQDGGQAESGTSRVGEKLCKHKYSSYPYCYGEIYDSQRHAQGDSIMNNTKKDDNHTKNATSKNIIHETDKEDVMDNLTENAPEAYTTIILREHETSHHGHAHTHGHVHSAPGSLSSVAWMVVMGDGLHNFTDGLAIGAAFASNIGGGVSTAVAVFCHELPHELGDFAVLLKAGMSAKQAVFYNVLSSVLCFFGMCIGIMLGHNDDTTQWVFAAAAGMFLYIALVDMVPELTSSHSGKATFCQCLLQIGGILTGFLIMLLIALYETDLKHAFKYSF